MTEEERKYEMGILVNAIQTANKFGPLILEDVENSAGTAATTAAFILSQYTHAMGMTMHDAMGLFMSVYKHSLIWEKEDEADQ